MSLTHHLTPCTGTPSPEQPPEQPPPRYEPELAGTPRRGTHFPPGQQQLPPLEHRPSSPVTLPSFNSLESFIRRCPSPDPILVIRHPQNGPPSSGPHLKLWKSENINNMVIDQPSASGSSSLAGQQLNVPAPSLPTGYPGYAMPPNTSFLPLFSHTIQDASPSR
jgi:hypothetical protein